MKTNFLLIFTVGLIAYFTLSSKKFGAGSQQNQEACGTPGNGTCMNCHSGGSFNPTTTITLKNSVGDIVTTVNPDSVYDVSISSNAANGTPASYGFQAIFLSDSANTNTGTFQNLGTGQATHTFSNGHICVEHNTPSASNTFNFKWKAPSYCPGGTATLYAYELCTNGSNSDLGDSGDADTYQVTVSAPATATVQNTKPSFEFSMFPNPTVSDLNLNMDLAVEGQYELSIFNTNGQLIGKQQFIGRNGQNTLTVNVNELAAGTYLLTLSSEKGDKASKSFVKF